MTEEQVRKKFLLACALLLEISAKTHYEFYVASDVLCLMKGPSHDRAGRPQKDNVVESECRIRISGGDW